MSKIQFYDDNTALHDIGAAIMNYDVTRNAFVHGLVNRIGVVMVETANWTDQWAQFDRGKLELGEAIEEVFKNICDPHSYDPDVAESEVFKREIPDVRAAFHTLNYQKFYKQTIQRQDLELAFTSWSQFNSLIAAIVQSMYTSMKLDLYLTRKYCVCRSILNGDIYMEKIADPTESDSNAKKMVAKLRAITNNLNDFMKSTYNLARVRRNTPKSDQVYIVTNDLEAQLGVDVMAMAFNVERADYLARRVPIDSWEFDADDLARLDLLFANDEKYVGFTGEEITALQKIDALVVDRKWFMNFQKLLEAGSIQNHQGLYWNYDLQVWYVFSFSPFRNAVCLTHGENEVTGVTVTPTEATVSQGAQMQFTGDVQGTGVYAKTLKWTLKGAKKAGTTLDSSTGLLIVDPKEPADNKLTLTAAAVDGQDFTASATVTVSAG